MFDLRLPHKPQKTHSINKKQEKRDPFRKIDLEKMNLKIIQLYSI